MVFQISKKSYLSYAVWSILGFVSWYLKVFVLFFWLKKLFMYVRLSILCERTTRSFFESG